MVHHGCCMVVAWFLGAIGEQQLHRLSSNAFTRKDFIEAEVEASTGMSIFPTSDWMYIREIGAVLQKTGNNVDRFRLVEMEMSHYPFFCGCTHDSHVTIIHVSDEAR